MGGAPIWSKQLWRAAHDRLGKVGQVYVMVGDFRFGNSITKVTGDAQSSIFQDGFNGIDGGSLTLEIDQCMLDRGLAAVAAWYSAFGQRVRFIFWDLFGRQIFDRLAGRHISDKTYNHPVFDYSAVVRHFSDADVVDLSPLLGEPMHEVRRLFIDGSCHPSQIGYHFLRKTLIGREDVRSAYRESVALVESNLFAMARRVADAAGGEVLLTGESVWLDTLSGYVSKSAADRLARNGLILAPLTGKPSSAPLLSVRDEAPNSTIAVVLSAGGKDIVSRLSQAFRTPLSTWDGTLWFDWETATVPLISARGEKPRHVYAAQAQSLWPDVLRPEVADHMVELGPLGMPSWSGIEGIFDQLLPALLDKRTKCYGTTV